MPNSVKTCAACSITGRSLSLPIRIPTNGFFTVLWLSQRHRLKPGNPLFYRRMSAEELYYTTSGKRVYDKHMRCGGVGIHGYPLRSHLKLPERTGKIPGIS